MTATLEGGEWSAARSGRTLPQGKTRYPFYRRLGEPQGRSGLAENLVPTGIRSRTVQPVAQSLYRLSYRAHIGVSKDINVCMYVCICIYIYIYSVMVSKCYLRYINIRLSFTLVFWLRMFSFPRQLKINILPLLIRIYCT